MNQTVETFQNHFDSLTAEPKLKDVGAGMKAFVAVVILILDRLPRPHTIIDQTALTDPVGHGKIEQVDKVN